MNVQFDHNDILNAIGAYAKSRGLSVEPKSITLSAGRGGNGYSANAEVIENEIPSKPTPRSVDKKEDETLAPATKKATKAELDAQMKLFDE